MASLIKKLLWPIVISLFFAIGLYVLFNSSGFSPVTAESNLAKQPKEGAEKVEAVGIRINGQVKAVVKDTATAQEVLQKVKKLLSTSAALPESLKFEEEISFSPLQINAFSILSSEEAIKLLITGEQQSTQHVVEPGDSLWSIAKAHGLTVEELRRANPQIQGDKLALDEIVRVTKQEPLVHVLSTEKMQVLAEIPFPVQTAVDNRLLKGQVQVLQTGKPGKREEIYLITKRNNQIQEKQLLASKVLSEPVPKIVKKGTRAILRNQTSQLASRSGSGKLGWPTESRKITSGFGWRDDPFGNGRDFHRGIDIDGNEGDPIYAAEAGVVTYAGWRGSYGLQVEIDHGNGLVTRYSHASQLKVNKGDKVKRGEIIALIGSTGKSTGSHLDLEVLINDTPQNPLLYLR